jgi:putative DNA primase/helicase
MTEIDWFPILTKILGPQCIELSVPPEKNVFCMGAISHNVVTEELTIGTAAPIKLHAFVNDLINEVKIQKSNGGGSGRAIVAQCIAEKMKAALRTFGFTNEEISKLNPEVVQNILASYCADPVPGFECLPPCDPTSPAHRKAVIEFWSFPFEYLGEGLDEWLEQQEALTHQTIAEIEAEEEASNGPGLATAVREAVEVYAKTSRMLDAALAYAKHGIPVFPCDPVTKVPIPRRDPDPTGKLKKGIPGTGGFKKATCDPIIITQWWKGNPHALIAVPMGPRSGVWCPDIDTALEHEDESVTALNALVAEHEPFETREHRSASGGPHVFFKWKDEQAIGCSPGQMPKGISIKGNGGYVVVPPSVRKGRSYTVFRDIDPIDAPQWLIDKIQAGKPTPKRDPKSPHPLPMPFEGTPQCDLDELAEAMRFVPNDNSSREFWVNWGLAIFAASGGSQRGLEIFDEWSRKWHGYNAADTDQRWYEMTGSPPNRTGANKIFKAARAHGWQPKLAAATPTYASAANSPATARDKMHEIVRGFLFAVENPEPWQNDSNAPPPPIAHAVCIDVGTGKTENTIEELARWLKNRTTKPDGPFIYATPRHNLNERIELQFAAQGINARIYRGREADDPQRPGQAMCVNLSAVRLAQSCHAEIGPTCCKHKEQRSKKEQRCNFFEQCGYQRQLRDREGVQVWILAIDTLFHTQKALGKPIAAIVDEELWQKGLRGVEANEDFDWSVAVDSISNKPPPQNYYGLRKLDLLDLRYRLASARRAQPTDGGVERKHFDPLDLNGTTCKQALGLEWERYNADIKKLGQHPGMSDHQLQALINNYDLIDSIQHTRRVIQIWEATRELLNRADINVSGRLTLTQKNGQRTVKWRGIKSISAQFTVPTLLLDATLPPLPMLQIYHPRAKIVADIKVKLPNSVHIRQLLGAPTSSRKLDPANGEHNLVEIRRYILARYLEFNRPLTLVICQQKVEDWLKQKLPDDIAVEHYNNVTGIDDYRDVRLMLLIGRTAPGPATTETITAALTGKSPSPTLATANSNFRWFDQTTRGIRLRDGSGVATKGDLHPDPDVEAVRYQIHEAELVQALGRGRAVNRIPANPLDADLLFNTAIPITVDKVIRWQTPSLLIETAIDGVMLTAPCDLMKVWPHLWPNRKAAYRTLQQSVPILPGFEQVEYQLAGPKMNKRIGYFNLTIIPDPHAWLEKQLGRPLDLSKANVGTNPL